MVDCLASRGENRRRVIRLYRLTQPDLAAAGLPGRVDPSLLQLFVDGVEQPLRVNSAANGRFIARDSVEFYATGADTPYTGIRTYWIVAGDSSGQRIPVVDGRTGGVAGPSSFPISVELKPREIFFGALINGDTENFFGPLIMPGEPASQAIDLGRYRAGAGGRRHRSRPAGCDRTIIASVCA